MPNLYQTYRPKRFADLLGQNHLKISLQNELLNEEVSHAYLFSGPRAVGKTTLARILAKSLNCLKRSKDSYEPCNQCANCLSIDQFKHLEVLEIDAASHTGVDNVRDNIISFAKVSSKTAKYKVFIIDEVHMLSISAFNALLKILEEPPKNVVFILCTTEIQKVPETIASRCQNFNFKKISPSEIQEKLTMIVDNEKREIDSEVLKAISLKSGGHLRDAESLLGQILALDKQKIDLKLAQLVLPKQKSQEAIELIKLLNEKKASQAFILINQLIEGGLDIKEFINELILLSRKLLLEKIQTGLSIKLNLEYSQDIEKAVNNLVNDLNQEFLNKLLTQFLSLELKKNSLLAQLPLELLISQICLESSEFKQIKKEPIVNNQKSSLSQEEILDKWPEFLIKIKKHNHSLSFILQNCQAQLIEKGLLGLSFKYKFHFERANDPSLKAIIEKNLSELYNQTISIKATINEDLEFKDKTAKKPKTNNPLIDTFGGKIDN